MVQFFIKRFIFIFNIFLLDHFIGDLFDFFQVWIFLYSDVIINPIIHFLIDWDSLNEDPLFAEFFSVVMINDLEKCNLFNYFTPSFLIFQCLSLLFFRHWYGPKAVYYSSLWSFFFVGFGLSLQLFDILFNGRYFYIDLGRCFFCLDLIDSSFVFCFDSLSIVTALLVILLASFALSFGIEYMAREAFVTRLLYLLYLFATSVIFLFFSYDFFLILFAWESIGFYSFLLVNFYSTRVYTIKAALKTFVFSRVSDMFMFLSFIFALLVFNTTDLSVIFTLTPFLSFHFFFFGPVGFHLLTIFSIFLCLSGTIKAAQFFAHVWLPDAMEAPTPASALIHSSTLVVAGIYLVLRFSLVFEFTPYTNYFLAVLGALTLSFGALTATVQTDIKKLVAYSTISQIGYLVCGCGFCCYEEVLLYLIIHALNKAFLFVVVGYIVHFFSGNTDMTKMGGLYLYSMDISIFLVTVAFNLTGLPYSAGFISKEFLLFQLLRDDFLSLLVRSCWLVSFICTPWYMFILIFSVIFGPKKSSHTNYNYLWSNFKLSNLRSLETFRPTLPLVFRWSLLDFFNRLSFFVLHKNDKKLTERVISVEPFFYIWNTDVYYVVNFFVGPMETFLYESSTYWSRITSYKSDFYSSLLTSNYMMIVMFSLWCIFFWLGESLSLVLFDYSSTLSTVYSPSFYRLKYHTFYSNYLFSGSLTTLITFYIYFLAYVSISYLIQILNFNNYFYFENKQHLPVFFLVFILFLFF